MGGGDGRGGGGGEEEVGYILPETDSLEVTVPVEWA